MGAARFLDGLFTSWINPNLRRISERVQQGTLDFVLVKPADSQFLVSVERAVGPDPWYFALALLLAGVLFYALAFVFATTTIWFVKLYNVVNFLGAVLWNAQYPVSAFDRPFRLLMTYGLPVYFMTTVPAEVALGRKGPGFLLVLFLLSLGLFLFSRAFWRFALRSYSSASS